MKKIFFTLLCAAALCSCGSKGYNFTGTLADAGDSVYLLTADRSQEVLSAAAVDEAGNFRFKGACETPAVAVLAAADYRPVTLVFLERGDLKLVQNDEGRYEVAGSPANEALTGFQKQMSALQSEFFALNETSASPETIEALQNRGDSLTQAALKANLSNIFGAYVLVNSYYDMEGDEVREYIEQLAPEVRRTEIVADLEQTLAAQANVEVGKPYIDLTFNDAAGNPVALSSLVGPGKWVLIDFWATWCGPCKREIPHLSEAYKEFHGKGFEIYGVSLDSDAEAWKSYVADHEMNWVNVLGTENDEARAQIELYAVQSIPSNFLISPEGIIVATNLRGEAVREKLAEVLE